ncbi:mannose-1-phosphate guanylyltransferase [Marinilabiliaceae bacterium JC040]|nr:mannose-1-phosphate guanylyltransferase [Marinilabiliaceae bacterium JC040]
MKNNCNSRYAVIMAGGVGSRLWPLSKPETPKQFIDIRGNGKSLLQETYERLKDICPKENIYIVTSDNLVKEVSEQLDSIPNSNILGEPCRRNTAACIAYASYKIYKRDKSANIIICPADHYIGDLEIFNKNIEDGFRYVENNNKIVCLGIEANSPKTEYGYIKRGESIKEEFYKVEQFTEKPNIEKAIRFLEDGNYLWNSGIFMWNIETFIKELDNHLPKLNNAFYKSLSKLDSCEEKSTIEKIYSEIDSISIDYGLIEKTKNISTLKVNFKWSDLGSWESIGQIQKQDKDGNSYNITNSTNLIDCDNCIVNIEEGIKVSAKDLDGYLISMREGNILICKKDDNDAIKKFSEN